MSSLIFDHRTNAQRVVFGAGSARANLRRMVDEMGGGRVLLIADPSSAALADSLTADLQIVARVDEVVQHVPVDRATAATAIAQESRAELVITVGGGSATGLGKAVALQSGLPLTAVPTTFAGSEATDMWGMTAGSRKMTGTDPSVLPVVVIYDVELTAGLPTKLAITSGMNALAHAVDSLWAPRADPINEALAVAGMKELVPALRRLADSDVGLDARESMLFGAYLSAVAFGSAGSGMHHKICHVLGGAYALPHAPTHAVVLPYIVAFNSSSARRAIAEISSAIGGDDATGGLRALAIELGAPRSLREIGMAEKDLDEAALLCSEAIPATNPRQVDVPAIRKLLDAAWRGVAPSTA